MVLRLNHQIEFGEKKNLMSMLVQAKTTKLPSAMTTASPNGRSKIWFVAIMFCLKISKWTTLEIFFYLFTFSPKESLDWLDINTFCLAAQIGIFMSINMFHLQFLWVLRILNCHNNVNLQTISFQAKRWNRLISLTLDWFTDIDMCVYICVCIYI